MHTRLSQSRIAAEVKSFLKLAIPLSAAQLTESSTAFVDTVMMGWLGGETLAAGGLGAITFGYLLCITSAIVLAVSPLVAQAHGAADPQRIKKVVQQGLWLSLFIGIPIAFLLGNSQAILLRLGQDANTVSVTQSYLQAIAWGFVPALGFSVLKDFVCALSDTRPVFLIVILGTLLNAAGNYIFMFGKLGLPALGLAGIGWSSTLSLWSMFAVLSLYILRHQSFAIYDIWRNFRFNLGVFKEVLQLGLPIGGFMAVEAGIHTVMAFLAGLLGTTALAAHQIAFQTGGVLSYQISNGIAIATTIRVGQYIGQGNFRSARLVGFMGIAIAGVGISCFSLIPWLMPHQVVSLYLDANNPDNTNVVMLTVTLLGVMALFQVMDGIQVTAAGALRGLKDTHNSLLIGIFAHFCIGLPISYGLGMRLGMGVVGLWWGLVVGLAIAAVTLTWRFSTLSSQINRSLAEPSIDQIVGI